MNPKVDDDKQKTPFVRMSRIQNFKKVRLYRQTLISIAGVATTGSINAAISLTAATPMGFLRKAVAY